MIDAKYIACWMNGKPVITLISALKHLVDLEFKRASANDEYGYWKEKDSNARKTKFYSRKARLARELRQEYSQKIF